MPNGNEPAGTGHGTVDEIDIFPRVIEWTVPDFFQLPKQIDYWIRSEEIRYYIYRCVFVAWPNGTGNLPGAVKLAFEGIGKPGITRWNLDLCSADGTVLRRCGGWKLDDCEVQMNMHIPIKEVKIGCSDTGIVKMRCTLYCAHTLEHSDIEEEEYTDVGCQTEANPGNDKLSSDLEELLITREDSNVTIRVEGEEFKVHKTILGARTPVFTSMFRHEMSENITNIVDIDDCDADSFPEFLHYLYTGRVSQFSPNSVFCLHKVADKYQVNELKIYCLEYIKNNLSVNTFCDALALALQYDEEELMKIVIKFVTENMTEIKDTEEWKNFKFANPSQTDKLFLEAFKLQKLKAPNMPSPGFSRIPNISMGSLKDRYTSPRLLEWIIPDFSQLPKESSYSITSPTFNFKQYNCTLVAELNGPDSSPDIMVVMLKGIGKAGLLRWELEIRRGDDTIMQKCGGWKKDGSEVEMDMFVPVVELKDGWFHSGFLTVKCTLFSDETLNFPERDESYVATGTQTELILESNQLSYDLEELLMRGDDSDVTIRVEDERFKAHEIILKVRTPMFTSMLKNKMSEDNTDTVDIYDCDAVTFREFLRYIYSGRVSKLSLNTIFSLHEVADKYQMNELKASCMDCLKNDLSVDTFCDAIKLALQYNEEELINLLKKFLVENMTEIKKTEKWQNFSSECPLESIKLLPDLIEPPTVVDHSEVESEKESPPPDTDVSVTRKAGLCLLN